MRLQFPNISHYLKMNMDPVCSGLEQPRAPKPRRVIEGHKTEMVQLSLKLQSSGRDALDSTSPALWTSQSVSYPVAPTSGLFWGGFPGGSVVKNPPANTRDMGSIPGLGRSPGKGDGNLLHYSCPGNPMDRGAWWATVHGVIKSWI